MSTYSNCDLADIADNLITRIAILEATIGTPLSLPLSIANGGTAATTKPAARLSLALSSIDLDVGTVINWALGDNFYNAIDATKVFTMTNNANGTSIQVRITNTDPGPIDVSFTGVAFPVSQANPFTIAAGDEYMVSITQIAGGMSGVFAGPYA
jgi:hypothetical protein